jgi:AcrR family transcriptional regulator
MATPQTAPATGHSPQVLGLRERKKQRTRDALVDAAHQLFQRQGYAATTVDEIAAAVEVSQRTFFRYFANKEQVALAVMAEAEEFFISCLRNRPAEETPLEAMRASMTESWRTLAAGEASGPGGVTAALELFELFETNPTLLAAHLRHTNDQESVVVGILAEREGVDPATDLRPRVLAAVFGAVIRIAHLAWSADPAAHEAGPEGVIELIERHFDQLGPALAGSWRAGS